MALKEQKKEQGISEMALKEGNGTGKRNVRCDVNHLKSHQFGTFGAKNRWKVDAPQLPVKGKKQGIIPLDVHPDRDLSGIGTEE